MATIDPCEPNLGCATTRELIQELAARAEVQDAQPDKALDLDYRTVDS